MALPTFAASTATIRGTVSDPTGAVIDGAQVTAKNEETGLTRISKTNATGGYTFTELPVGTYQISVEHSGFKGSVTNKVTLNVADTRTVDVQLSTGPVQETITIEASPNQVNTAADGVSGLITGEQVRELPLNGRNFLQLALLMPGVSAPDFLNVKDKGLLGGSDLSVSGSTVTSNVWTVDGANNNDVGSNRTILVYPSVDAIEEFKIHRNSYGAEFGGAGGAQINVVTRGGTNDFHGTLLYFGRNDALNSTNYFLKKANKPKEELSRNDFGWTFGGPLVKDKLHFFLSQEWNREQRGSVRNASVPTLAEREGNFSQGGSCAGVGTINDPANGGAPFPGNVIPAGRISPAAKAFMQLYPAPNNAGCPNWVDSVTTPINWRQENARVDWTLNNSTRVMVRYTQDSWVNDAPSLQSNLWGDDPYPAVDSKWDQPSKSFIFQLNKNIGAAAVNSLTFSYSANKIIITRPENGGSALNNQITSIFQSTYPQANKRSGADLSHPTFWGGTGAGPDMWSEAPFNNNQDLFVLKDDYSQVFGKHFVKIGVTASSNKKNEDQGGGNGEAPAFWGPTGYQGWGSTTGNRLSDFMLKDMSWGFGEQDRTARALLRWKDIEVYAADSWKVDPRITFDYGVRFSYLPKEYQDDQKASMFHPSAFNPAQGGDPCNGLLRVPGTNPCAEAGFVGGIDAPTKSLMKNPSGLIAPRLGVAWDVSGTGKTALRAGLGLFYVRERVSPSLGLAANPPFARTINDTRTFDNPCSTCFGNSFGRPTSGRELDTDDPNNLQWNFGIEHELFRNTTLEVAYIGNKGNDLLRSQDINQVADADNNGNGVSDRVDFVHLSGNGAAQGALRPYPVWGDARIVYWTHSSSSIYHSLQTQLVSRFGNGSQFQASYTFSRTIGTDPLDNSNGSIDRDVATTDLGNPDLDRGLTRTHRAHVFNASLVLNLPKLDNSGGLGKALFGDWQIGTIFQAQSGTALTVYTPSAQIIGGGAIAGISGTGYPDNNRPNAVEGVSCKGTSKEQIFNPAAFTLTGFKLGGIGTSGRGVCEGPGLFQTDLALYKNVHLSQRLTAQLRFDIFNVFNNTNFLAAGVGNAYVPNVTTDAGTNLAAATTITSSALPANSTFGQATTARDPRQAQFAIKLIF
jgi:hypothetical protein